MEGDQINGDGILGVRELGNDLRLSSDGLRVGVVFHARESMKMP